MPEQDVAAIDLPAWLAAVIELDPSAEVVHFEGRWRTWSWLSAAREQLDGLVSEAGFGPGTRLGVVMRNRPEIVRTIVASLATSQCLVTLSSAIPVTKLSAEIRSLRLPFVIASASDWDDEEFTKSVEEAGSIGLIASDGDPVYTAVVPGDGRSEQDDDSRPGVAVQMLTSGTTGAPKRIDLLYRGLESEIASTSHYSRSADLDAPVLRSGVSILWNPLLHIGGLRGLITSMVGGRRVALLERFSVDGWADAIRAHRPRVISLVPTALAMVLDADLDPDLFDGVDAVISGTAPLDPALGHEFERRYGVPVLVVYGATEFAGGVAGWTIGDWRAHGRDKTGSVGRPNRGVEVRVVDPDTGDELERGKVGLLEVRAPQLVEPGWTRTTDMARMDDDDFIWITGRADDVILRGGFKVNTGDVAAVLMQHPAVLNAVVLGIDDPRLGQAPVAAVQVRPDAGPVSPHEVLTWARERLTGYEVPVQLEIVAELPRTPSMKVSQAGLRPLFEAADP